MHAAVAPPKPFTDASASTDFSDLSLAELESDLKRIEGRIGEVRAQLSAAREAANEVEDAYISGELDDPSVAVATRRKKNEIQHRLVALSGRRQALQEAMASREKIARRHKDEHDAELDAKLDALVRLSEEIEGLRQAHDAAFIDAVTALDRALDAMTAALTAWKQKTQTFRQKAGQLERSVLSNERSNPEAAAFLRQLQERGADLQAVVTARSGVAWPQDMYKVAPTYWLPAKGAVADTVESLLRERMRKEQDRTLQGGR